MIDPRVEELLEEAYVREVESGVADGGEDAPPARADWPADVVAAAASLGFITGNGAAMQLTSPGLESARDIVRRHRLAERLLRDVLAVGDDQLDKDACQFEHILRPGLEEKVCVLLGHPASCPHGKPIPPGECCRRASHDSIKEVQPLSEAPVDAEGSVAYLSTRDQREIQKLMAIGILPGVRIRLLRRFPSFVFQVGYSQFTVDRELAAKIVVHWQTR